MKRRYGTFSSTKTKHWNLEHESLLFPNPDLPSIGDSYRIFHAEFNGGLSFSLSGHSHV